MEKYNLKIKEYNNQITASLYNNPVMIQDKIDNIVIQLKKYRTSISELMIDNGDGTGVYACWKQQLEDEINMVLFDEDMEHLKSYVTIRVPNVYTADILTDYEREQKSLVTSLNRTKGKVYDIAYANDWNLFVTLTFDDAILMKKYGDFAVNYEVCVKALHSFFTSLKNQVPELQYLGVPELHHTYYDIQTMKAVDFNGCKQGEKEILV